MEKQLQVLVVMECSNLPDFFQQIYAKEYHQSKEQKLKKPQLLMEQLRMCSGELFDVISTWDRTNMLPDLFMNSAQDLARSLEPFIMTFLFRYYEYFCLYYNLYHLKPIS